MPVCKTKGWLVGKPESRFLSLGNLRVPVMVRRFVAPNDGSAMMAPLGRLEGDLWGRWLGFCRSKAAYDPDNKLWVFSWLLIDRYTTPDLATPLPRDPKTLTIEERKQLQAERKKSDEEFQKRLAELSRNENIPEAMWDSFHYPEHCVLVEPRPTALQRIVVSRYWDRPYALIGVSVGGGKTRMVADIMQARALAPKNPTLNDSVRIVLVVAPLSTHENFRRELIKWSPKKGITWAVHKFDGGSKEFWDSTEHWAARLFGDADNMKPGGIVIITTPQSLSRTRLMEQLEDHGCIPTCIVVDEVHRFFRKPDNKAYKNLMKLRRHAMCFYGLSGTPTSKFEDWWALEELISGGKSNSHWRNATYTDYQRLGDPETMTTSGLWQRGWTFDRAIQEYHADRITKGHIFRAEKSVYMADSLPNLGREELGEFADMRLSFYDLFNQHEDWVKAAWNLQQSCNPGFRGSGDTIAQVLLLRMSQLAAMSNANEELTQQFVNDFLEDDEPAVFWCMYRNDPCPELPTIVKRLSMIAPTAYIQGGMTEKERWQNIDDFQNGKSRFFVAQVEAGGVGLTLTRAARALFLSLPLGWLTVAQCEGRLHRIGQTRDVIHYFAMTSPVAAFARAIHDRRSHLNEVIPQQLGEVLRPFVGDALDDKASAGA